MGSDADKQPRWSWLALRDVFETVPAGATHRGYPNETDVAQRVCFKLPCGGTLAATTLDDAKAEVLRHWAELPERLRVHTVRLFNGTESHDLENGWM